MKDPIDVVHVQQQLIARGVWLRPFGRLLYTMPPFVIRSDDLAQVTAAMRSVTM